MKKISLLLLIVFGITLAVGCKNMKITSQWKPENLKVDGNGSDWEAIPLAMSDKINGVMGIVNDVENQYIILKLSDQRMVRRIQMMGLTIWINSNGKKKKEFGIRYTGSELLAQSLRPQRDFENQTQRSTQFDKMREKMKAHLPGPGMIGIIQNKNVSIEPEKNPWGPSAASAENKGVYCYEFKIPLQFDKSVTDEQIVDLADKIKVCLEIGGISDEVRNEMQEQMDGKRGSGRGGRGSGMGRGSGGMGGGRGGGMKGGGARGGGGRMTSGEGLEKQEIWLDVVLTK
jgi:uncharacterized membrane protein YgcG